MRTLTVAVLALAALALVGALAVGAVVGFGSSGYDETTLHTFETTGPACPAENPENRSGSGVYARPTPDGQRLSVVDNVTARGASALDADVTDIGPGRYQLSLSRTGEADSMACEPEIRYNATMNVSRPDDYTLVVTLDGELREVLWAESAPLSGSAGASSSASAGGAEAGGTGSDATGDGASGNTTTNAAQPT